jgi:RimJ/RimL family protein N-acetyltransferase
MTEYTLRKATDDDYELSFEIRKNALGEYVKRTWGWDEDWQWKYHKDDFNPDILKIIEVGPEPAGSLEIYTEDNHMIISGLYITDKFQNQQIGTRIMTSILRDALANSANVKLQVLKVNLKAKALYERLGFRVLEITDSHYKMIYKHVE